MIKVGDRLPSAKFKVMTAEGPAERTTDEIARSLHISPKTVANLHSLIKDKLGVASDIELVRLALRQGILIQAKMGDALGSP